MSHLGRRLSALVDGELGAAERDQALAHLVRCEACRAEVAALRILKRRVRGLGEAPADGSLTRRLMALEGLPPAPPSRPRIPGADRARAAFGILHGGTQGTRPSWGAFPGWLSPDSAGADPGHAGLAPAAASPFAAPATADRNRPHARYLVAGAVAALAVGLGAASFAAGGGGQPAPGPTVTPQVDSFNVQHAATFGEMPASQPSGTGVTRQARATRQTVGSLRP